MARRRRDKLNRWQNMRSVLAPKGFWSQLTDRERSTMTPSQQVQFFLSHREDRKAFRDWIREGCQASTASD